MVGAQLTEWAKVFGLKSCFLEPKADMVAGNTHAGGVRASRLQVLAVFSSSSRGGGRGGSSSGGSGSINSDSSRSNSARTGGCRVDAAATLYLLCAECCPTASSHLILKTALFKSLDGFSCP